MYKLSDKARRLIEAKNFAQLATLNKDGSPQVSPVWVEMDGDKIVVNSENKRLKVRNMRRDPRVSVSVQNSENPYEYVGIKGKVVDVTTEGGFEGIDRLAKKYLGQDKYPGNGPGDERVVIRIEPLREAGQ
jgi:PPOX class probable F420-dependent enzyme